MDLGLAGKVALISGASRGIGLSIARAFAAEGVRVALVARSPKPLNDALKSLIDAYGQSAAIAIEADMTDAADIARAFDSAEVQLGSVDIVVANVGSGTASAGAEIDRAEWDRVLSVNLLSGTLLAAKALKALTGRGRGNLIFVSSIAGVEAIGAPVAYSAAKAALQMAMKLYARQVGVSGVRVNAVAPGNVLFPGGTWAAKLAERREYFEGCIKKEVALQRFGTPNEIADVVVFLASERASFTTGAVWVVDGGQSRSI